MKKIISVLCLIWLLAQSFTAFGTLDFIIQEKPTSEPLLEEIGYYCYKMNIQGDDYFINTNVKHKPIRFVQREFDFFVAENNNLYKDYIWTGEYYFARKTWADWVQQRIRYGADDPVRLYDSEFNVIKEFDFEEYVFEIDYVDGLYYSYCDNNKYYLSIDFENWTQIEEKAYKKNCNVLYKEKQVSFDGNEFHIINYENEKNSKFVIQYGDWIIRRRGTSPDEFFISKDNIYFVKINPTGFLNVDNFKWIYESGNELILDFSNSRFTIPKQLVYNELEKLSTAPYIMLNGEILGFEEPPVIEDGRTLVPMRFIFEKLGADVNWNDETQTVTASNDNSKVLFSINDTTAKVNNDTKTMDVPARLVNAKTMVPLRFLSEELGYNVEWDEANRIVNIKTE